jgi:hypothetical protein
LVFPSLVEKVLLASKTQKHLPVGSLTAKKPDKLSFL